MANTEGELTYASAFRELEQIVSKLQRPDCDVDQLCVLTERSLKLISFCKEKLTKTDKDLESLLARL